MQPIGLFGGTFDPIHYGHLRTAFELWQELRLTEVRFMPTGSPPHREQPYATPEMRLDMVKAAVASQPAFVVDDREIRRTGVSYSVDTLTEVRNEFPDRSLCLQVHLLSRRADCQQLQAVCPASILGSGLAQALYLDYCEALLPTCVASLWRL